LHHVRSAEAAGAAGLLLAPVSYLPLTDDDFAGLVADVAGATDLPICLYNNPTTTGFTISDALAIRLSELPGVKAVKNPAPATYDQSAQHVHKLCTEMSDDFVVGYSGDALIAGPLAAGAQAWYSVVAGTLPDLALAIWNARDDKDKVYALHGACAPLWDLFAEFGGIRVVPEVLNLMGLGPVTSPKPLLPLGPDAIARIEAALDVLPTPELERA
ncbi:MAG: dihydrodipicolinate synthase family protein, partial [Rhodobacteraceae bacterium]|nr:dihydrodipicolinate synthase family protein [Paracoccaceae bacterium]